MPFSDSFSVPIDQIWINREERQRRRIAPESLVASVAKFGIFNPLIVKALESGSVQEARGYTYELVAGERRITAANTCGLTSVPIRLMSSLDPLEAYRLELEENLRREDLTWQDRCRAIAKLHNFNLQAQPSWTMQQTAEELWITLGNVSMYMRVSLELEDPRIHACNSCRAAYDLLGRRDSRVVDDTISEILEVGFGLTDKSQTADSAELQYPASIQEPVSGDTELHTHRQPIASSAISSLSSVRARAGGIFNLDFLQWAPQYSGPKFNLLHCDFPYGIDAFSGGSNRQHKDVGYDDSPDIYWALLRGLCENLDKLLAHSAHIIFWFSMNHYQETLEFLHTHAPGIVWDPFPLIWHKSDNAGMIPDANRGGRRTYETALFGSREDRKIIKPLAISYAAPTDKTLHPSTKPVPVLKHFFSMLVDNGTRLLDPTCGSGSALRAAEDLGCAEALGLELDPEHFETASRALRAYRALKGAAA